MKLFRRLALVGAATAGLFGAVLVPFATPAKAETYQIGTPPGVLVHVCLRVRALDTMVCVDI